MTNFDFLYGGKKFSSFAGAAAAAEKIFAIDSAACAVNVRRAAELAVKWMYENDPDLPKEYRDNLASLTGASEFRATVGAALVRSLEYIRRLGNNAAHNPGSVTPGQAELALLHLYDFACFIAGKYSTVRPSAAYDKSLLDPEAELVTEAYDQAEIRRLIAENRAMKRILNARRTQDSEDIEEESRMAALSEADTRRLYIETALESAGWQRGIDCFTEYPVAGIPGGSGVGYADYVLCDRGGVPLAIVETQAAGRDIALGRQQAKLYADALTKRFGRRPVIFLSDGFDTRIWPDGEASERPVGGFYSPQDLMRLEEKRTACRLPARADIDAIPALRPYQRQALQAVCEALCRRLARSVFITMAPGSGKTRTALATADLLRRCGWVKNMLFLSENEILSDQACRENTDAFPGFCSARLSDRRAAAECEALFTTFEELLAEADELCDKRGRQILSAGHFDLVICDEADRTSVLRYRDVFAAFDAPILALSSAPADQSDRVLCDILRLTPGDITFSYSTERAVREGTVAAMEAEEVTTALLRDGILRNSLSEGDRRLYDKLFPAPEEIPDKIPQDALFTDYFNIDTVRVALMHLREHGHSRNGQLGKTIIFTKNHEHSEMIYEEWAKLFPADPPHFCRVIDSSVNYVRTLLQDFISPDSLPCVALSHDLLRDGVNIPAAENLVFFTRAPSRSVFWRMLGRGMRRCDSLPGGKPSFYVLDLCGNFRTFGREGGNGESEPLPVWSQSFALRVRLSYAMQSVSCSENCAQLRGTFSRALQKQIRELDRHSFSVRRHLATVDRFCDKSAFTALSPRDAELLCETVAPIILPDGTPLRSVQFDVQMYTLMLSRVEGKPPQMLGDILRTVQKLYRLGTHRKIAAQKKLLNRILYNGFLKNASPAEIESTRRTLSPLIRYLPAEEDVPRRTYFPDRILSVTPIPPGDI